MHGMTSLRILFFLAVLAALAGPREAGAAFDATLFGSVSPPSGGFYTYSYTFTVLADSTMAATEMDLALPGPISSINSPSGDFLPFYNPGDPDISFIYAGTGIGIGGLGVVDTRTFSFTSVAAPTLSGYTIGGADPTGVTLNGITVAPSAVPEPSSFLMCGVGAVAACGLIRRGKRHSSP